MQLHPPRNEDFQGYALVARISGETPGESKRRASQNPASDNQSLISLNENVSPALESTNECLLADLWLRETLARIAKIGISLASDYVQPSFEKRVYCPPMDITAERVWADFRSVRELMPLVLSLTNSVVQEFTANALLALGASPIMSDALEEIVELVGIANALNLNIGTPTPRSAEAMALAAQAAESRQIPIVLDPVAVGATRLRSDLANRLLEIAPSAIIRGNQAEIAALAGIPLLARGVDAAESSEKAILAVRQLAKRLGTVAVASGPIDYLSDGKTVIAVDNGHPLMARITGSGCVASALIAAFLTANPYPLSAALSAMIFIDIAGELAAEHSRSEGPSSFRIRFLDTFDKLEPEHLEVRMKVMRV
jgi:hydroxyethylthiazole kinase